MQTLIKFNNFINELKKDNSRNYKISILTKYRDDEDIKYYLNFVYNNFIVTGISDKKLNKKFDDITADYSEPIINFLEYLRLFNTGTDEIVKKCQQVLNSTSDETLKNLLYSIITKNLPLGIDAKTINKVIPNLIPEFSVMLANKYFDKPELVEGKKFAITTKIDGMRCIMLKAENEVTFWSRQGQQIIGLVDLENEAMNKLPANVCLDGELVAISDNPDTYKQTMKLARTKDIEKHGLKMKVFDAMSVDEFKNQNCPLCYDERRINLLKIFGENKTLEEINSDYIYFELLNILYEGTDTSKIIELLNDQTAKGEEGIMINISDAKYDFKRTNSLLKVKKFLDTEVLCIGFEEGTNSNKGTLGALICEYKNNTLKVGSGFSEEQRDYIWKHKYEYLNQYITIKYFEETYNSITNLPSLRFPVFLRKRLDSNGLE